jgi:hypothetical protein
MRRGGSPGLSREACLPHVGVSSRAIKHKRHDTTRVERDGEMEVWRYGERDSEIERERERERDVAHLAADVAETCC